MSEFFIRRPVVATVIAIVSVLIGVVALIGLPIEQFPQILPPQVNVTTTYTGGDALAIEQAVAMPVEKPVNGVDHMLYVQSTNANDGTMNQVVTFDVGTDIDVDNVLVNNRVSQAQPQLPHDVKNFGVTVKKSLAFPLIVLSLYSTDNRYDSTFLANYANINVNDALLRVKGVGDLRNLGAAEYAVRIWLDSVRVKDVAHVELGALTYDQYGTFNGKPAAVIAVFQTPGSNALETAAGIRATIDELKSRFPSGMAYAVTLDTTAPVTAGVREIVETLLEAVGLLVLVVFVFLRSWRATLIPLLTVPVSLVGVFAVFPLLGFPVNALSLFGLVLAIGLVVDDAIVVVEAVEHHIEHGLPPLEATSKAMREVQGPVIAIALILAAVFIPVAFLSSITGRLYEQFALTIAVSVLISAFNALTLSPALSALLLRPRGESHGVLGRLGARFGRTFGRMTDGYVSVSRVLVRKLAIPLVLLLGITAIAGALGRKMPTGFVPDEDQGYAIIAVQLPDGASLERTKEVWKKVDAILAEQPGISAFTDLAGYSFFTRTAAPYIGNGFVAFTPWEERNKGGLSSKEIVASLNKKLAAISEARIFAIGPPAIPDISAQGGFSMMLQDRGGNTYEYLAENTQRFVAAAQKRPELAGVRASFSPAVPQLYADVDEDEALRGVRLRDPRGAPRELVASVQRPPRHPRRRARGNRRPSVAALRQRRVCADRPRDARRADGEERDPHRRVRGEIGHARAARAALASRRPSPRRSSIRLRR